jgi:glutaconate CoA-transferase subunit B
VVSNLAILGYHPETLRMMLLQTQPGITVDEVVDSTGFELALPDEIGENDPPSERELKILREEVDQDRLYI